MQLSPGQSKTYLKSEFIVHVNYECDDHCLTCDLSEKKKRFFKPNASITIICYVVIVS